MMRMDHGELKMMLGESDEDSSAADQSDDDSEEERLMMDEPDEPDQNEVSILKEENELLIGAIQVILANSWADSPGLSHLG